MTYIIAEIGQNHNGSMDTARQLIDSAAHARCNAVKFTLRDLNREMTTEMAESTYLGRHSYGETYGDHRVVLELSPQQVSELVTYANEKSLEFVLTLCSASLFNDPIIKDCLLPKVAYIKVASRDVTNVTLLEKIGEHPNLRVLLSSGLSDFKELSLALHYLRNNKVTIMHCVSKYPTPDYEANMVRIKMLREVFKDKYDIGYSDHTLGAAAVKVAVSMGCKIIEKHITMDTLLKGSDHTCSADPYALKMLVFEVADVEQRLGSEISVDSKSFNTDREKLRNKLMRSVCTAVDLKKDQIITEEWLCLLSPGTGISGHMMHTLIGKRLIKDIPAKTLIRMEDVT